MKKKKYSPIKRNARLSSGRVKWGIVIILFLLTIPFTILLTQQQQDTRNFAQVQESVGITPEFGCLGACPTVSISPSQTLPNNPPDSQLSVAPSNAVPNTPEGNQEPCEATTTITNHRDDNRRDSNWLEEFFQRLIELIQQLIDMLDGGGNRTPEEDNGQKESQENPKAPDENAEPCPPTDEPVEQPDTLPDDPRPNEQTPDEEQEVPVTTDPSVAPEPTSSAPAPTCTGASCAFEILVPGSTLISKWGDPRDGGARSHEGVDLEQAKGSPCFAIESGVVTRATQTDTGLGGITLYIQDDKGRKHYYAHLLEPASAKVGELVTRSQELCKVDNTGNARSTVSHLHYQVSTPNGDWADPEEVLKDWPN